MVKYLKLLKINIYMGIFLVAGLAMLGSVWGARRESKESLPGITQEDILHMQENVSDNPELTGIFPLAAEQNRWYNFKDAALFGLAGVLIYFISMGMYMRWYHWQIFEFMRNHFCNLKNNDGNNI